jgi:hypothetical protein
MSALIVRSYFLRKTAYLLELTFLTVKEQYELSVTKL